MFGSKSVFLSSFYGENVIIPSHSSISRLNKSVVSPHVRYDGLLAPQLLSRTLKDSLLLLYDITCWTGTSVVVQSDGSAEAAVLARRVLAGHVHGLTVPSRVALLALAPAGVDQDIKAITLYICFQ